MCSQGIGCTLRLPALTAFLLAAGLAAAPGAHGQTPTTTEELAPPGDRTIGGAFELVDGDRVVLLGSGFLEAAQEFGYIEAVLTMHWPDRHLIFRNLGWSGDTVFGEARARFTSPPTAYERLLGDATAPDPSVIFVGYGSNVPSEEGDALGRFDEGLRRLLDDLEDRTDARFVLLSPPRVEVDASPAPAHLSQQTNDALADVTEVIRRIARERGLNFVDVFDGMMEAETGARLTNDGIQLNEAGHLEMARIIEQGLGLAPSEESVAVDDPAKVAEGAQPFEHLRQLIIQKNHLVLQQYRPPNETYLVGFRSYEQGQNAGELERLTPLIEKLDGEINRLKRTIAPRKPSTNQP